MTEGSEAPRANKPHMREFVSLLGLAVENRRYLKKIRKQEQETLGGHSWYRALNRALKGVYFWNNAFQLSRRGKRKLPLPSKDLIYGETPPLTAWLLLERLGVDQADHIVECGAGRAVFSLVAALNYGCSGTALEVIPSFVRKSQAVADRLGLSKLTIKRSDILEDPLPEGTVYYITGTTFSENSWQKLQRQMAAAPKGARAISLSTPLDKLAWRIDEKDSLEFSWGTNTVYLQTRI